MAAADVTSQSGRGSGPRSDGMVAGHVDQRWPSPGMSLPVTVDRVDPQRVKIEWDDVASSRDRAQQTAEGMAAAMRGEGGAGGSPDLGNAQVINLSGRDLSDLTPEQQQKLRERFTMGHAR